MVYLMQFPFLRTQPNEDSKKLGLAPGATFLTQHHLNPYPPIVSSALLTHVAYDEGDWIVSFSGCKIFSSQEVCNALFFNYFMMVHGTDIGAMRSQRPSDRISDR